MRDDKLRQGNAPLPQPHRVPDRERLLRWDHQELLRGGQEVFRQLLAKAPQRKPPPPRRCARSVRTSWAV